MSVLGFHIYKSPKICYCREYIQEMPALTKWMYNRYPTIKYLGFRHVCFLADMKIVIQCDTHFPGSTLNVWKAEKSLKCLLLFHSLQHNVTFYYRIIFLILFSSFKTKCTWQWRPSWATLRWKAISLMSFKSGSCSNTQVLCRLLIM